VVETFIFIFVFFCILFCIYIFMLVLASICLFLNFNTSHDLCYHEFYKFHKFHKFKFSFFIFYLFFTYFNFLISRSYLETHIVSYARICLTFPFFPSSSFSVHDN